MIETIFNLSYCVTIFMSTQYKCVSFHRPQVYTLTPRILLIMS